MCNLYCETRNVEAIRRLFRVSHNRAAAFDPLPAIFPGYRAPIVRQADDGERELVMLNWGFMLLQKDRAPRRVTNVRDDKILTSPFWRPSSSSAGAQAHLVRRMRRKGSHWGAAGERGRPSPKRG